MELQGHIVAYKRLCRAQYESMAFRIAVMVLLVGYAQAEGGGSLLLQLESMPATGSDDMMCPLQVVPVGP